MKKRDLKKISLNKKVVSNFKIEQLKGGALSDLWHYDEDGMGVCCSFFVC